MIDFSLWSDFCHIWRKRLKYSYVIAILHLFMCVYYVCCISELWTFVVINDIGMVKVIHSWFLLWNYIRYSFQILNGMFIFYTFKNIFFVLCICKRSKLIDMCKNIIISRFNKLYWYLNLVQRTLSWKICTVRKTALH